MWKKKGEVVYLWCDLSTPENTVCVCHGKHTQWKEGLLFTSGNSKHFFCFCVATQENVWVLKTAFYHNAPQTAAKIYAPMMLLS